MREIREKWRWREFGQVFGMIRSVRARVCSPHAKYWSTATLGGVPSFKFQKFQVERSRRASSGRSGSSQAETKGALGFGL